MLILNDSPVMTSDAAERFGSFKGTGHAREGYYLDIPWYRNEDSNSEWQRFEA